MLLLTSVIVGVVLGLLLGGRVSNLGNLRLRLWPLLLLALLTQVMIFFPPFHSTPPVIQYGGLVYSASLVVTLVVLASNLRLRGMHILLLGAALNATVILANGGQMPVDQTKLAQAVESVPPAEERSFYLNTTPMTDSTRLAFLGDVILVPEPLPMRNVFSIGDILIGAGAITLLVYTMKQPAASPPKALRTNARAADGGRHPRAVRSAVDA